MNYHGRWYFTTEMEKKQVKTTKGHIHKLPTAGMSRAEWLLERKKSLGGSDMGAVLGLNPWASPYSVWAEKTGKVPDKEENEAMRLGRDLEDYVCHRFMEVSGLKVQRHNYILRNDNLPCIHANVDRLNLRDKFGLEAKTASALNASKFTGGEFPGSYYAQCVTYLAVTEYKRWYLAALVLGKEFHVYQMTRIENDVCPEWCDSSVYVSPQEIEALGIVARDFWRDHVEKDVPPPVDGTAATSEALGRIMNRSNEQKHVDLTGIQATVRAYLKLAAENKERNELMEKYANQIKTYLGDAAGGSCELAKISWKVQARKSFDLKKFQKDHPEMDLTGYYNYSTSRPFKVTVN